MKAEPDHISSQGGRLSGALASLFNCAAFLAGAAVVCFAIEQCRSFPRVPDLHEKYAHFAAHGSEYDTLFIGTSRFYHQIIPRQFDAAVEAKSGTRIRSFNASHDALFPPESYYFLRQLLATRPAKLRWVFVEMANIYTDPMEANNGTLRRIYWHDWKHTLIAWRGLIASPGFTSKEKWLYAAGHGGHLFKRWSGAGLSAELLGERLLGSTPKKTRPIPWRDAEGFYPGPDAPMQGSELRNFEEAVAQVPNELPKIKMNVALASALSDLIGEIRAAGAQPIFVITPGLNPRANFAAAPGELPLFAFNDPHRYPALFEAAVHYDAAHLNKQGAVIFTELLAASFSEYLAGFLQ